MKSSKSTEMGGFSLIEVTLSIAIVAVALLAIVALVPIGLKSVKNANEQSGASAVLERLADALRHSGTDTPGKFEFVFDSSTNFFSEPTNISWPGLTLEGSEDLANKRLTARMDILAIPTATSAGRAVVSVAWSAASNPIWAGGKWTKAEGSMTSGVIFLPQDTPIP